MGAQEAGASVSPTMRFLNVRSCCNMGIIVRDIQEKEMTVYNPDGSILVVTHNMLCIDDICLQIKEQSLEGYTIEQEGSGRCKITKYGRIKGSGFGDVSCTYAEKIMGF